ncbi:hypothetical protein I9W82_000207 [Candida metapsilosis]|uniref:Uncharacterized protein n=1 Tax=Candida metapsilosis TaxID=273372 RepID=A0A8H8DD86_9ASCO|nr:hypothetical protein I9W82_000207 [Candida metapsilosis]
MEVPSLCDPQYNEKYEVVHRQIAKAFPCDDKARASPKAGIPQTRNHLSKEFNDLNKLIAKSKNALNESNKSLDMTSTDKQIDTTMINDGDKNLYDPADEFYNEILELDKFSIHVNVSPFIFCANAYSIKRFAEVLSVEKSDVDKVHMHLNQLRGIGRLSLKLYWQEYLGKELNSEELNYPEIVAASGIFNALDTRLRRMLKSATHGELQYSFVFYQYLGLLVVKNGQLSSHFILSLAKFTEKSNIVQYHYANGDTSEEVDTDDAISSVENDDTIDSKKKSSFAEYTLKLLGKRIELLQGHTTKKKDLLLSVKERFPELRKDANMGTFGQLITTDYRKYALEFLKIQEPRLSFALKFHLIKVFSMSNFELPVIYNHAPQTASPYQILAPVINPNLPNRILLLSRRLYFGNSEKGRFMGQTIQNFELFGNISYAFFIRLALERVQSTTLTSNQLRKIREIVETLSFKSYIVDLMEFFENQNERISYMSNIEKIRSDQLIYLDQFNSIFACLSEGQKENWCNDLITKIVTVVSQLDWQYIDEFLVELRLQLLKRKEFLDSLASPTSNQTKSSTLRKLQKMPLPLTQMEYSLYYNLGMEYLSYLNVKYHIPQSLGQYRRCLDLFEEKLLRTFGFDSVTRLGYSMNDIKDESIGIKVIKEITTHEEKLDKSFSGISLNHKLKFRLGKPGAPFWNYTSSQLNPPKLNLETTMNKFLLINHKVASEFFKEIGTDQHDAVKALFKYGDLGFRYYRFIVLYFLSRSKLSPMVQESVFNIFTDKAFKKKLNFVSGVSSPFLGDLKTNHIYHRVVASMANTEYLDLYYHHQAFNQFIAMQYSNNKDELNKWIKGLMDPLIRQLEECAEDYDRQAVLYRFELAYKK